MICHYEFLILSLIGGNMAIPQYQDFMTPVLTAFQDNQLKIIAK